MVDKSFPFARLTRSIKTLHTPIYDAKAPITRTHLLAKVKLLNKILNSCTYNRTLLCTTKYNASPKFLSSRDTVRVKNVIDEYLRSLHVKEASKFKVTPKEKLEKLGLELFLQCNESHKSPVATTLACSLAENMNRYPDVDISTGINMGLDYAREFLLKNKIILSSPKEVDALVDNLVTEEKDSEVIKKVLKILDYDLTSDDMVRVIKGQRVDDEVSTSQGWKFFNSSLWTNEAYLRSLEIPKNKLVSLKDRALVLVYDGTLRDAKQILPSLHYATTIKRSLVILTTGDCVGDALTSIIIHNNKNRRGGSESRALVLKYIEKENDNLSIQENYNLLSFLNLPNGFESIYTPDFSSLIPSKVCANKYFGKIDTLKATSHETFLYNSETWDKSNGKNSSSPMRKTITLYVGGFNEIDVVERVSTLDNAINNILSNGLAKGFLPAYGSSLIKVIPGLEKMKLDHKESNPSIQLGLSAVIDSFYHPMECALNNSYGIDRSTTSEIVSRTIQDKEFDSILKIPIQYRTSLEPWNKMDDCIRNLQSYLKLACK